MIVAMKKVLVLTRERDAGTVLERLRALGVLHVEHWTEPAGPGLAERRAELELLERAERLLASDSAVVPSGRTLSFDEALMLARSVAAAEDESERLREAVLRRTALLDRWAPWGDVDPRAAAELKAMGCAVALFEGPAADLKGVSAGVAVEVISRSGNTVRALLAQRGGGPFPLPVLEWPPESVPDLRSWQQRDAARLDVLRAQRRGFVAGLAGLRRALTLAREHVRFEETAAGLFRGEGVVVVKGFCPVDRVPGLEAEARTAGWGVAVEDPLPGDRVPTLIRNPEWVRIIAPLFRFMNIIPGYREADVSLCFLVFFSLFFGILIGDAGYGLLFWLATMAVQARSPKNADPAPFRLFYILSGCAIAWGLATGTFFGTSLFGKWVKPLVPWLTEVRNVQQLCFVIGVVHLTIAHLWRGMRKWPSVAAVSEAGWIALLWSAFFFAGQIILDTPVPGFVMPMLWSGVAVVILFNQPHRNIFVGMGLGLGDLLLGIMGVFIDLISYIRLFAVGAASLALAESFNVAVTGIGFGSLAAGLGTALILVLGHSLNIVLCLMAVMVHGLRLNILEFSGHQGIEWSGVRYEPFAEEAGVKT